MKKFFKFMLAAVVMSSVVIACSKDTTKEPNPGPDPDPTPDMVESIAETSDAVSIRASEIANNDFNLNVDMGIDCVTYRLDVMPHIRFLNNYQEALKKNAALTEDEFILSTLINSQGSAGYGMSASFSDSWANSSFKQAEIVNGIDYIVLTVGCLDEEALVAATINTLVVPLKRMAVVGDPKVDIKLTCIPYGFKAEYTMNEDCYGFYSMEVPRVDADDAVRWFGEDGLRQLVCCFQLSPSEESYTASQYWPYVDVAGTTVTAIVTALDINGNMASAINREDGVLPSPEDLPLAVYSVEIGEPSALTAPSVWTVDYTTTKNVYFRWYTDGALETEKAKFTDEELQLDLAMNGGWAFNRLSGESPYHWMIWSDLLGSTHYTLVSTATNASLAFSPLNYKEFTTKSLVKNKPEEALAQINATIVKSNKTSARMEFDFPEGDIVRLYYFVNLEKGVKDEDSGIDLTDPANAARMRNYVFNYGNVGGDGGEAFTFTGLDPDKTYVAFCLAEGIDGYLSNLVRCEYSTASNAGGPSPTVKLSGIVTKDEDGYLWNVEFECNDDVTDMKYGIFTDETIVPGVDPTSAQIKTWTDNVIDLGLTTIGSSSVTKVVTQYSTEYAGAYVWGVQGNPDAVSFSYLVFNPKTMLSSVMSAKVYSM